MKKVIPILIYVLFGLTLVLPLGTVLSACFGYSFELCSAPVFAVMIAVVSAVIVVLDFILKNKYTNQAAIIISAIIIPFSLINAVFFIFVSQSVFVGICMTVSLAGCVHITLEYGDNAILKALSIILAALMLLPACLISFLVLVFGDFGVNTVVKTVESPNESYYAEVIYADQGALGGDFFVRVCEDKGFNALIFKLKKAPIRINTGEISGVSNMNIYWKDDNCLVINSKTHKMK